MAKVRKAQDVPQSGSVVYWLKRRLQRPSYKGDCITIADEIAQVMIEKALVGDFPFTNLIIQRIESEDLTREEAVAMIEHVYATVSRHVKDQAALAKIANDLTRYKDRLNASISNR